MVTTEVSAFLFVFSSWSSVWSRQGSEWILEHVFPIKQGTAEGWMSGVKERQESRINFIVEKLSK